MEEAGMTHRGSRNDMEEAGMTGEAGMTEGNI